MPLGFGAGQIAKLVAGLVEGDSSVLEKLVEKKLEGMGEDFIMQYLGGPLGTAQRITQAVQTGGQSEFDRTRDEFLHSLRPTPPHLPLALRKTVALYQAAGPPGQTARGRRYRYRVGSWQASSWAASRQDWLDNRWHHDWRSQPRDQRGRWVPGRLDHIAAQLQYRGKRAGRTVLRRRKIKRMRRLIGRKAARQLIKGNRDGH